MEYHVRIPGSSQWMAVGTTQDTKLFNPVGGTYLDVCDRALEMQECPPLYKKRTDGSTDKMTFWLEGNLNETLLCNKITNKGKKDKEYKSVIKEVSTKEYAQVCLERLVSKWNNKKDRSGWSVGEGCTDVVQEPMLLHKWEDYKDQMTYPALLSPKLNGVRATYNQKMQQVLSRKRVVFSLPEVLAELRRFGYGCDGELWSPRYTFEELVGIIKSSSDPRKKDIEFWVFDKFTKDIYVERLASLMRTVHSRYRHLKVIPCIEVNSEEEVDYWYNLIMEDSPGIVDGVVIRTLDYKYMFDVRSKCILKKKALIAEEYTCTGITWEPDATVGTLICLLFESKEDNIQFKVIPNWSKEVRSTYLEEDAIGSSYTLEFREYTVNGIPKHVVSCTKRDYE